MQTMSVRVGKSAHTVLRQAASPTMQVVFDFDGTITKQDTIGELAQSAIRRKKHQSHRDLQPVWEDAVQEYLKHYQSYRDSFIPSESDRKTIEEEQRFLAGLKPIEEASLTRVSRSGLFAGLTRSDLMGFGKESVSSGRVQVNEGYDELIAEARSARLQVNVISVNWSTSFIKGVLHNHNGVNIMANEIHEDGHINGPFPGLSRITTASDKLEALHRITGQDEHILYFGDSTTDLACLLFARGIILARDTESSSLLKTLSRLEIDVPHVGCAQGSMNKKLFWARDFREVMQSGVLSAIW